MVRHTLDAVHRALRYEAVKLYHMKHQTQTGIHETVSKGDLLIASVKLLDPNFQNSVVLVCEHTSEGSYGLILNRPISPPRELKETMPYIEHNLFEGGPVRQEALQIIHPYGDLVAKAVQVMSRVWIGGDFTELEAGFKSGVFDALPCKFCLGYAGWGPGQLEDEFKDESWLRVPATPELIYDVAPDTLWQRAIRQRGILDPLLSHFPVDPGWN